VFTLWRKSQARGVKKAQNIFCSSKCSSSEQ
jgi:hypothetical protein